MVNQQSELESEDERSAGEALITVEGQGANENSTNPVVVKKKFFFRYRLWMLFLLFIPAAIYSNWYSNKPYVFYSENKADLINDSCTEITFATLPDGKPTVRGLNVDDAYQSLGVSFAYGTPDRDESSTEPPLMTPVVRAGNVPVVPVTPTTGPGGTRNASNGFLIRKAKTTGTTKTATTKAKGVAGPKPASNAGFIGISGYPFKFPQANYPASIACFRKSGRTPGFMQRFQGKLTIRFHKPNAPNQPVGVKRVGFFAARLNTPETLEVRLYSPNGRFLCRQSNISSTVAFMGFESGTRIGRVEIETVGLDEDYAITGLVFD